MQTPERRKNHRSGLRLPIELILGETVLEGMTQDVSLCGASIALNDTQIHVTTKVCKIRLQVIEKIIDINCLLVRQTENEIGLEFIESSVEKTRRLTEFLKHKL